MGLYGIYPLVILRGHWNWPCKWWVFPWNMVIFRSFVSHYQRVNIYDWGQKQQTMFDSQKWKKRWIYMDSKWIPNGFISNIQMLAFADMKWCFDSNSLTDGFDLKSLHPDLENWENKLRSAPRIHGVWRKKCGKKGIQWDIQPARWYAIQFVLIWTMLQTCNFSGQILWQTIGFALPIQKQPPYRVGHRWSLDSGQTLGNLSLHRAMPGSGNSKPPGLGDNTY